MKKLRKFGEWAYRAARTFLQAVAGCVVTNAVGALCGVDVDYIRTALLGLIASAVAAGVAAVMNLPSGEDGNEEVMG
uniref:Holin n=1 Tax=uncultured bacterium scaffold00056 TaxID=1132475 RepID=I7AVI3_9BACT|nr:hypothetical protein [uncultured bacterium scaffold00056]